MFLFLEENNVLFMHVFYFNDTYKRNWIKITQIYEFLGKNILLNEFPKITVSKMICLFNHSNNISINKLNN